MKKITVPSDNIADDMLVMTDEAELCEGCCGWKPVVIEVKQRTTKKKKPRCNKCIHELRCPKNKDTENKCPHYKRDAPDGGFYG